MEIKTIRNQRGQFIRGHARPEEWKRSIAKDIAGETYGRLTAIRFLGTEGHNGYWLCRCECGKTGKIRRGHLLSGGTESCGCLRNELTTKRVKGIVGKDSFPYKHGCLPRGLYGTWSNMKERCYKPKNTAYKYYGGRGIEVYLVWKKNFKAFRDWALMNGYKEGLTIDRVDNNRGYYPDNCQWITRAENSKKRNREVGHMRI